MKVRVRVKVKGKVRGTECGSTDMAPRNVVARSADRWRVPLMGDNGSKGKVMVGAEKPAS